MVIVSDTSPLTNLIKIGKLDLLQSLFTEVIIPQKVFDELANHENQIKEIKNKSWVVIQHVSNIQKVKDLENLLDPGEAEAIILAQEINADFLIVDEKMGRKIAIEYGLSVIGLLGILIAGKNRGHVIALKPLLDQLVYEIGFYVKPELYQRVLDEVNE